MSSADKVPLSWFNGNGFSLSSSDLKASSVLGRLVLLGVEHGDPRGFVRTRAFLDALQPDLVLVELSPFGRSLRAKRQMDLLRTFTANVSQASRELDLNPREAFSHPDVVRIGRQICLPYEYRAARRYLRTRGARLVLCDASELSRRWLASWPEMISLENVRMILSSPRIQETPERGYALARKALHSDPAREETWTGVVESRWPSWWDQREQVLARRIWTALNALNPKKPVYLGGWQHLVWGRSRPTLRKLLNVPATRCTLLADATSF